MKNLLLSTAIVLSTATLASADSHGQLAMQVDNELATMNVNVDIDSLTEAQIKELYAALTSSETADEKGDAVRVVLNDHNVMFEEEADVDLVVTVPRSQIRAQVLNNSEDLGLTETRIRLLDDEKLAALFLLVNSDDPQMQVKADAIVN